MDHEKFERVMKKLNVPEERVKATEPNANWFLMNTVLYKDHPDILTAIFFARRIALKTVY
jgi:hypothetical protein